jgi:chromosome condensin MukBEF ATPase and DNA-binding subunit MukB
VARKILSQVSELHLRQDKLDENVEEGLTQVRGERLDRQGKMETEFKKVRAELQEIKRGVVEGNTAQTGGGGEIHKLQKEIGEIKVEIESTVNSSVRHVREGVEETLKIERRKCNLVIHGMPEIDAEKDVDSVMEIMTDVLHIYFTGNVDKMQRIGRLVEGKSRPS